MATRAAVPWLKKAGGGFVINTSSVAARVGGTAGAGVYGASKGFVSTMTHGMARELIGDKIRVNAVSPGFILTPFQDRYAGPGQRTPEAAAAIPQGRFGVAEDCVGAYLFLASEMLSGYIIGQVIEVNGGQLMP